MKKHEIKITDGLWDAYKHYKRKKGVPGITTSGILDRLEYNINQYHPDMIVAMMGINDHGLSFRNLKMYRFLSFFKAYKMVSWILQSIKNKTDNYPFLIYRFNFIFVSLYINNFKTV